ncbi:MAG: hypothetical protein N2646_04220 [Bellilinea sp.]|jgi:hypothetical protein|nr:hypothetical protein [Bellilinea sp.]
METANPNPPQIPAPRRAWLRPNQLLPSFWTIASVLSLIVNAILIAVLIGLGSQLFALKRVLSDQLIEGLYQNFVRMDEAHIRTVIPVRDQKVRANFTLHIKTPTTVTLAEDTLLPNAQVLRLNTGGLTIYNAPADIVLKAGTDLPIFLDLEVPVDQEIPVNLDVNVDIPLRETDLHAPFTGLQEVVLPYRELLNQTPDSWSEALCGQPPLPLCLWLFGE